MSGWNLSGMTNLYSWGEPIKETFVFRGPKTPVGKLNNQLRRTAPSVGIDLPPQGIQGPPNTPSYTLPSFYDPTAGLNNIINVNQLDAIQERDAWDMHSDLVSARDIKQLQMTPSESFCKCLTGRSSEIQDTECGKLSEYKCKNSGCCVFTSNNKCVAGDKRGPSAWNAASADYYYYKNKCYGSGCIEDKKCK